MAVASTTELPVIEPPADAAPAEHKPKSRFRSWMVAPIVMLALILAIGGYYGLMIRDAFSTMHALSTPPAAISGSVLGGSASTTIDTSAAKTAVAQAAAGIETPTESAGAAAAASPTAAAIVTTTAAPAVVTPSPSSSATASANAAAPSATSSPAPTKSPTPTPTATPVLSEIERIVNGGFEQGETNWYTGDDVSISDHAHTATQSLAIGTNGGYASQRPFMVPGSTYQLSAWVSLSKGGQTGTVGVLFLDANENKLTSEIPAPLLVKNTNWAPVTLTYTVPSDAASVEIYFWKPSGKSVFYVDDVSVRGIVPAADQVSEVSGQASKSDAKSMNILMMGVDARPGEAIDSGVRPDSLMVIHLDNATGTCRVLAIPRDTRTELPGYGLTKINHALAVGGVDYEKLVVQNLLGLKINHFVLIDFNGFQSLVDAVGGITITVPYEFTATDGTTFTPGTQQMSGAQALSYARFRGGPDGDFGRINRQQQVMRALISRASDLNIVRSLNELLPAVADNLRTDLSAKDMATLASDYRSRCTPEKVTMLTLDGTIATYQDPLLNLPLSYVVVDPTEVKSKVAALLEK